MEKYSSYNDSGLKWVGEIPNHYIKTKFKYVSKLYTGNSLNDKQKELHESENLDELPYVSSKDIDVNYQNVNYNNDLIQHKEFHTSATSNSTLLVI